MLSDVKMRYKTNIKLLLRIAVATTSLDRLLSLTTDQDHNFMLGFYELNASSALIQLREYLIIIFNDVIELMKKRHHYLREFRVDLIVSRANASAPIRCAFR